MKKIIFTCEDREVTVTTDKGINEINEMLNCNWFINLDPSGKYTIINLSKVIRIEII